MWRQYVNPCNWVRVICAVFGILFLALSFTFFLLPYRWISLETVYFAQHPFYVLIIFGVLSFTFSLILFYAQHKLPKDKGEAKNEVSPSSPKANLQSRGNEKEKSKISNPDESQLKHYDTALKLLTDEVGFNWHRLSCFLMTNSILFAAWALIFARIPKPPRVLLIGIALSGALLSIIWRAAAKRGNTFHFFWMEKLRKFEEDRTPKEPEEQTLFLQLEQLTKGKKITIRKEDIQLKGLAKRGIGNFFIFLSGVFLTIYILVTVYSIFLTGLPFWFPDPA